MPCSAALMELISGGTKDTVAYFWGEKMPSLPCHVGNVAIVCTCFGSALLLEEVWRTEHMRISILLEKVIFQSWMPPYASVLAKVEISFVIWNRNCCNILLV
eukprot:7800211-Ditylum_brightwellii.AAC.1